jgi:hypothetical protein
MLLLETFTELSAWVWIAVLLCGGVILFLIWLASSREDPLKAPWAPLIPAYVLTAIGVLVALLELNVLRDPFVAPFVLAVIALPFLVTFLRDRSQWWALIPTYVLLAVGLMVLLTEGGLMDDDLVPPYVLFAIAIPFFVVFARNTKNWWALIPAGILTIIGISFLIAEAAAEYIGAIVLVAVGLWIVARQFFRKESEEEESDVEGAAAEGETSTTVEAKAEGPAEEPPAE